MQTKNTTNQLDRLVSKLVRQAVGLPGSPYPIVEQDGFNGPELKGEAGGWFTKGGSKIYYPSAYARDGRSNMVYHYSTLCIEVGIGWICQALAAYWDEQKSKQQKKRRVRSVFYKLLGKKHPTTVKFDSEGKIINHGHCYKSSSVCVMKWNNELLRRQTMSDRTIEIEVHYTASFQEKDLAKLMNEAEERGCGYGDPGKKELLRRLLIDGGFQAVYEKLGSDQDVKYVLHPIKDK